MVAETLRSDRGRREPRGLSPRPHYHEKSQQRSSGEASGRGGRSLQSPGHHKSRPYFPPAKVRWLRCLPIPEPVFFAAYLKLGNPQELQAGEAVCQEPPGPRGDIL